MLFISLLEVLSEVIWGLYSLNLTDSVVKYSITSKVASGIPGVSTIDISLKVNPNGTL